MSDTDSPSNDAWKGSAPIAPRAPRAAASLSLVNAVLGGLSGHRTELWGSLLPTMSFRHAGRDVPAEALYELHVPRRGPRRPVDVAVYVHGLLVDESNWTVGRAPIAPRLERIFGWAPLYVRYNTGRHVSENGEALADLLERLHGVWGHRLGRVQVFGHSMGGLVSRSALYQLEQRRAPVLEHIDRLFLMATPNHGADLERIGHATEYALNLVLQMPGHGVRLLRERVEGRSGGRRIAETVQALVSVTGAPLRTIEAVLGARSDGIRDVRFGYLLREEWESAAHDEHRFMLNHRRPVPPPESVRTWAIAGSLWPDVGSQPSRVRNDGLVTVASAAGRGEFDDLGVVEAGRFAEIPTLVHQLVPSSRRVLAKIRSWIEDDPG